MEKKWVMRRISNKSKISELQLMWEINRKLPLLFFIREKLKEKTRNYKLLVNRFEINKMR